MFYFWENLNIMALGEKLKHARLSKNFSQEYMAEMLDVSQKTYSNFENDKTTPSFAQIEKISNILETSILSFLTSEKVTFNQTNSHGQNNGLVINNLSDKLIEQYELRLNKQQEEIEYLKALLDRFSK